MAIGRNDPCPCGSGQKYKKCCLAKDEAVRAAERPRQSARERVMPKLLRFADSEQFDDDHDVADALFWGDYLDRVDPDAAAGIEQSDDAQAKYNAWFIWDLDIDDGLTIADMFLEHKGGSLDPAERAYVDRLRHAYMSLYQVERVDRGHGLELRDLLTKETTFVHERLGSEQIVPWDVLGARVAPNDDGRAVFEGGLYLYPPSDKAEMVRVLKRYQRKYSKNFPGEDVASFLKRHGMVFNHLWLELVVCRPMPRVTTAEGNEMVFARSVFDVADEKALRAALESRDEIEAAGDGSFTWGEDAAEFRRTLGTFRFERQRLVLETTSRERDLRGREWLATAAPNLATYRATELETLAQALARAREHPTPPPKAEVPPEVEAEIVREMQDRHYRKWLEEPLPALRGATPRAAAASRTLRPRLVDLLRDLENHCERARLDGRPAYDPSWLWDELGVRPS